MKLGQSESEIMRIAFMEYAKGISLTTEKRGVFQNGFGKRKNKCFWKIFQSFEL
jgi:hypothetical protein